MTDNVSDMKYLIDAFGSCTTTESKDTEGCFDRDYPPEVSNPLKLTLISKALSKLPKNIILDNFVNITLEGNSFCEFPPEICALGSLKYLSVAKNKIKILPNEVGNLRSLEYFNCSENLLETLPVSLSMLSNLLLLNVCKNRIISIPEELSNLKRLKDLNLSCNNLKELPVALVFGSKFISQLDLSYNRLKDFSKEPKCSGSLKILKVNNNSMEKLPFWMRSLQGVEEFHLGNNQFKSGAHHPLDDMMPLPSITIVKLSVNSCGLKNFPISLKHMKNLVYLSAGNENCTDHDERFSNSIWDVTPCLSLCYLKELRLSGVGLPVLPENIWTELSNLEVLDLRDNAVMWLPEGFTSHTNLTVLILSCNLLALLPNKIGAVKSLRELRLDGNKLHELPESIGDLENLIYLDLYDNELSEFPPSILKLHCLKYLDLEHNNFVTEESLSEKTFEKIPGDYVVMRENLRDNSLLKNNRHNGSKEPQPFSISGNSGDSENESSSLDDLDYEPDLHKSFRNCSVVEEEENWDESDGSDNFFDPKLVKNPTSRSQWHWARDNGRWEPPVEGDVFCPADIHPDLISRSLHKDKINVIDGQFDDADDISS